MEKRKFRWDRLALVIINIICVAFFVWFIASFIDTNLHNQPFTDGYQDFADWNLFTLAFPTK